MTSNPVAIDSLDHTNPFGTINDNTVCPKFVDKIYKLFSNCKFLDLGCAGGGLVKEFYDKGSVAVGLEGSDYNIKRQRAEWATIPNNLFTCDITKPFAILDDNEQLIRFDVISCWEVMEHIKECDIPTLVANIKKHLSNRGYWMMSVSLDGKDNHHVTVKSEKWWNDLFKEYGFMNDKYIYEYISPNWPRCASQEPNSGSCNTADSFHLCLRLV